MVRPVVAGSGDIDARAPAVVGAGADDDWSTEGGNGEAGFCGALRLNANLVLGTIAARTASNSPSTFLIC